jgi:hypothetical protein
MCSTAIATTAIASGGLMSGAAAHNTETAANQAVPMTTIRPRP